MRLPLAIVLAPLTATGIVLGGVSPPAPPDACPDCAAPTSSPTRQHGTIASPEKPNRNLPRCDRSPVAATAWTMDGARS
jgi:hypothetical protein